MRLPPLNAIRAFEAAARLQSFKKAAEELFVTPAAVSYQIKVLEEALGVELFERENRKVILTPAAQRALPFIAEGFDQISKGVEKLAEPKGSKLFTVSAGPAFIVKWLAPRMHDWALRHPEVNLNVMANLSLINFRTDSVDAAVRFGVFDHSGLFVEKLIDESVVPLCHPLWLEQHGPFESAEQLFQQTLIHDDSLSFNAKAPTWQTLADNLAYREFDAGKGVHFTQADHALQSAVDGAGVVLGRRGLATPDIEAGRLIALFPEHEMSAGMAHYFVCLEGRQELPEILLFRLWLRSIMGLE